MSDPVYKRSLNLFTQQDVCRYLKITPITFKRWEEKLDRIGLSDEEVDLKFFTDDIKKLVGRNPQYATLYARLMQYDKPKEIKERDFSPDEYVSLGIRVREELRREFQISGCCPVCHFSKTLCGKPRDDPEPEHQQSGTVAIMAVPA